jgi:uncharacterized protein DUF5665
MVKRNAAKPDLTKTQWMTLRDFALSLERGRFNDYVETLQNNRELLWKGFLSGLGKGFGAVVGATLVVALVVGLLALLGEYLPGPVGDFFEGTGKQIEQKVTK